MASHPAKRQRTEPGPLSPENAQQSAPSLARTVTTLQSPPAESHATPTRPPRPLSVPENMTMPVHEALEYIDPDDKTPHDLYLVLIYAAAAHSDVAEMMDRFACVHRDRLVLQGEMRGLPATTGSVAQFVPVMPKPPRTRPGRPHGPARPKEVIEAEKAAKAARRAARLEAQAAQAARPKVNTPAKAKRPRAPAHDKDFAYLVRRAETELELGRTGPKQDWSQKKRRQYWQEKAVEMKAHVVWLQEQILQNMTDHKRRHVQGMDVNAVTFGTKKNGLVAMKDLLLTILVDTGELGRQLRMNWFSEFLEKFKKAIRLLRPEESAALRQDREWYKELRPLAAALRANGLTEEVLEDALTEITPGATIGIGSTSDEEEESDGLISLDGSDDISTNESDGALVGGRFLEQVHFERFSDSEAESSEEESSDIG